MTALNFLILYIRCVKHADSNLVFRRMAQVYSVERVTGEQGRRAVSRVHPVTQSPLSAPQTVSVPYGNSLFIYFCQRRHLNAINDIT